MTRPLPRGGTLLLACIAGDRTPGAPIQGIGDLAKAIDQRHNQPEPQRNSDRTINDAYQS
jgi:hypothetical protein